MKHIPITLSFPENLIKDLHLYISKRQISKFVSKVVEKELQEKINLFIKDYKESAKDPELKSEIELWDRLSNDGLNETNLY